MLVASNTSDMANSSLRNDRKREKKIREKYHKKNVNLEISNQRNRIEEERDF